MAKARRGQQTEEYTDQQKQEIEHQLENWLKKSGKNQKNISNLSVYFNLGDCFDIEKKSKGLSQSQVSRIFNDPSTRKERVFSLCYVLAVLYALEVVDRTTIENFFDKYDIRTKISRYISWNELWHQIEDGAVALRIGNVSSEPDSTVVTSIPTNKFHRLYDRHALRTKFTKSLKYRYGIAFAVLAITTFGFILFSLTSIFNPDKSKPISTSELPLDCSTPVQKSGSTLLPAQGFSQYLPSSNNPQSTVLNSQIRSISINEQGLWVGYAAGVVSGISHYDGNTWQHCMGLNIASGQNINDIAFRGGEIFVATDGSGIWRLDNSGWYNYTTSKGLPSNSVYSLIVDEQDVLWATTYEGVARLVDNQWQVFYQANPGELASNRVHTMLDDSEGDRWFALINRGISRLDSHNQWFSYYTDDSGLQNVRNIAVDNVGGIWFATDGGGVLHFQNDEWTNFTTANSQLPSDSVQDIERDKYGRIWVATDRGVAYTSDEGQTWIIRSTISTLDIEFGCTGCVLNEDHMWLVLDGQGLGNVRIPPVEPTIRVVSVPPLVRLEPGESYVFQVEVETLLESLLESNGDSLKSIDPPLVDAPVYGAWSNIPVRGEVQPSGTYIFSNIDNPIVAPDIPGRYQIVWQVWQAKRFTSEPIVIEFEVVVGD